MNSSLNTSQNWAGHLRFHRSLEDIDFKFRIPGRHIIMTMEPENVKAILATQFHEFGKGEEFHARWQWVTTCASQANSSSLGMGSLQSMAQLGPIPGHSFDHNSRNNASPI